MSWLDGLVEDNEVSSQDERLDRTAELPEPGFFRGSLDATGRGLVRGVIEGVDTLQSTAVQAAGASLATDLGIGASYTGNADDQIQRVNADTARAAGDIAAHTRQAENLLAVDPTTTGMAGQILNEAAAILPRTIAGTLLAGPVGGAVAAGAPAGFAGKQTAQAQGVDENTAMLKGGIDALTTGAGVFLPAARIVGPVVGDAALAIGANVGLGAAGRGATGTLLERNGYTAQAAQYKAFDKTALLTDAVLGAAFFGVGRLSGGARPTTDQVDAALTERTAQHADVDTAPGAPVNPRSAVAHQDAIRTAIEQLQRGEPVTVPESIHSAEFLRAGDEPRAIAPTRDEAMATARAELEPVLRSELQQDATGATPNVRDIRTELAGIQRTLDGIDDTFKDRAKQFQQEGQSRKQAEASARQAIADERGQLSDRQTALNDSLASNRNAEQARADLGMLDRGDIPPRFVDRLTERADAIVKGFEPSKLAAGVAEGNKVSIEQIARGEINRILSQIEDARAKPTAKELDIGQRAPETVADAGASKGAKGASEGPKPASEPGKTASNDVAKPETPGGEAASDPVLQVADEILARADDVRISTGAIDADGNAVTVSARELLVEADADIAKAQQESKGFAAAAACFLQRGV